MTSLDTYPKQSAAAYEQFVDQAVNGPQNEGISTEMAERALEDSRTITVEYEGKNIPAIVPIEYAEWYNSAFYDGVANAYYFALPPHVLDENMTAQVSAGLAQSTEPVTLFFDYLEESKDAVTQQLEAISTASGKTMTPVNKKNGEGVIDSELTQLAAVVELLDRPTEEQGPKVPDSYFDDLHSAVSAHPEWQDPNETTRILTKPVEDKDFDQLWDFYKPIFDDLNSDHPLLQSFDEVGFKKMLNTPNTLWAVASFEGEIVSAAFIAQVKECEWIKQRHYQAAFPEQYERGAMFHIPTLVTKDEFRRDGYTTAALDLLADATREVGDDFVLLGECNDVSINYVPLLADAYFNDPAHGMRTAGMQSVGKYHYQAVTLS